MSTTKIEFSDQVLFQFENQIKALGEGDARKALARAVNHTTRKVRTRVIRAIVRQSSIPRSIVARSIRLQLAAHKGSGPLEGIVYASGNPISLKHFKARQMSYGVRAKVWGEWRRYPNHFMGPRPGVIAPKLRGHVFQRTMDETWINGKRTPIELQYGPSVPQELVKGESAEVFHQMTAEDLPARARHELARLLT